MIQGFQKITKKDQEITYGGWAWLVALVPLLMQTLVTTIASIKSIFSDKGSLKGKDISATWDDKETVSKTSNKRPIVNYFAY